jgi:protein-S-isoprenylcysteine O-methyltransferase Ste14
MFLILLGFLIFGGLLIIYQKLKALNKEYLYYIGIITVFVCMIFLPFFDPLQMLGYLAAVIQFKSFFSIFGAFASLIVINIGIYGFAIFYSSMELITADRYKGKIIDIKAYKKIRHPIFASYHLIGSAYFVVMGSPIGLIIISVIMVFINFEAIRIEKRSYSRRFGASYQEYKRRVPKRLYNDEIMGLLVIIYGLIIIGIIGLVFLPQL